MFQWSNVPARQWQRTHDVWRLIIPMAADARCLPTHPRSQSAPRAMAGLVEQGIPVEFVRMLGVDKFAGLWIIVEVRQAQGFRRLRAATPDDPNARGGDPGDRNDGQKDRQALSAARGHESNLSREFQAGGVFIPPLSRRRRPVSFLWGRSWRRRGRPVGFQSRSSS